MLNLVRMKAEDDSDGQEREIHALFETLRAHTFSVTESFRSRVAESLDEAESRLQESPESLSSLFVSSMVQLSNLALGLLRGESPVAARETEQASSPSDDDSQG